MSWSVAAKATMTLSSASSRSFVRRAVELDAAAFQQVVEEKRAVPNDFDVFSPVVVVPLSSNRVDVLGVQIRLNLLVVVDEFEYLVQLFVGEGVVSVRVVCTPPVLGLSFHFRIVHGPISRSGGKSSRGRRGVR